MTIKKSIALGLLVATSSIASNAAAAPVDNPGTFTMTLPASAPFLEFPTGNVGTGPGGESITIDLDSAGAIDPSTSSGSFAAVPGLSTTSVQLLVNEVSGNLDATQTSQNVTVKGRLRFTGASLSGSCVTPVFTVNLSGATSGGGIIYDLTMAGSVAIQPVPTTGTCSSPSTVNTLYGFNGTNTTNVRLYKAILDVPILGS